ncbi:putative Nitrate excretion transporter1 [Hibiscus syriacus]|uniref:Nitrate excretion transporter1 n=1 Tax=Hibiscus syriacus TaxID=106335 RepID=A0A6A2XZJ4_HIBSY|nr:putative Nitrate excretion transporter1 [Hibiscus syriacus]
MVGEEVPGDGEAQMLPDSARKHRGTLIGSSIAVSGRGNNLIVYMIEKFHVRSIDATQTFNIAAASTSLLPMVSAILADSFLGCYNVIWMSSLVLILGIILLALTAMLDPLRPRMCPTPSKVQFRILYLGIALGSIVVAGTSFTISSIGTIQFDDSKDQRVFFNWFAITLYTSVVLGATVIVYINENCKGSPFTSFARVVIATIVKRKVTLSSRAEDYCHQKDGDMEKQASLPSKSFRFLNHAAAMETEADTKVNGSTEKPWRLCSLVLVGLDEAFHYPGQVALYHQEFPKPLRSTATAMILVIVGLAYYLSTTTIDLVQRVTT